MSRVAFIGLDGWEPTLGDSLLDEGLLPELAALRRRGLWCPLDGEAEYRSGLVWEQLLTGKGTRDSGRTSAVGFDPATYRAEQEGARECPPFYAVDPPLRVLSFDVPYTRLDLDVEGVQVTGWGGHDPGYPRASRPPGLLHRIDRRFGPHPACNNDYACVWWRPDALERQASAVLAGAARRADIMLDLLRRQPKWDLLLTVLSETHSVGEQLWHGIDADHPLAAAGTAARARTLVRAVYEQVDRTLGRIVRALPADTTIAVASLHGMSTNRADVLSMALLPELLYRWQVGEVLLRNPVDPETWRAQGCPPLSWDARARWLDLMQGLRPGRDWRGPYTEVRPHWRDRLRAAARRAGARIDVMGPLGETIEAETALPPEQIGRVANEIRSQPTVWYRDAWPRMRAFALPTYYDGRIRFNLAGRERDGVVAPGEYVALGDEIEALLRACRDVRTGRPVVDFIERPRASDPLAAGGPESDLVVVWAEASDAIEHPTLGTIGPFPFRRTGGHSPNGFLSMSGPGIEAAVLEARSSLDVTPTLLRKLGRPVPSGLTGRPLSDESIGVSSHSAARAADR